MSLRLRLAFLTVLVGLPLAAVQAWIALSLHERDANEVLSDFTSSYMQSIGRAECERDPENWIGGHRPGLRGGHDGDHPDFGGPPGQPPPFEHFLGEPHPGPGHPPDGAPGLWSPDDGPDFPGHGPPPREVTLYGYAVDGTSRNPKAPALDAALLASLRSGRSLSAVTSSERGRLTRQALMAMTWTTGPCALVLARRSVPLDRLPLSDVRPLLAPIVTVLVAVLLAAGPLVRRIRLLTQQVRRYAESHYAEEITVGGRDEIGALARAFTEAGAEIRKRTEAQEARERTLRAFLENTTHDVMIPLTVLQGHLTTLREQAAANTAPDAATISAAMGEAHYLGALMHNLAVAAKLEASEPVIQRTPVDLNALVSRVAGRHAPLARQKGVALERALEEKPLLALADVTLAEQAVSNVVFNAVRYNHEGGHVAVILERAKSGDRFLIKVIDDGPGIPPEEMSRLVERHFRGNEARSRDPNGHGLGLNIAWRATEMHGWVLRLSASEFGGLQVEIEGQAMPVVESER